MRREVLPKNRRVSDEWLLNAYLTQSMQSYFVKKLPELSRPEVRARVAECLKGLAFMTPGPILFSADIDTIWHYWILQTEQYAELCARLPGRRFLHHSSNDYPVPEDSDRDKRRLLKRLINFFAAYSSHFGPMRKGRLHHWPALERLMQVLDWDLARTNAFLHERARKLRRRARKSTPRSPSRRLPSRPSRGMASGASRVQLSG
jgi:hypothetical protein